MKVKSLLPRVACLLLLPVFTSLCVDAQTTGSITGRVVNESGQPMANVAIYVQPIGGSRVGEPATTDRDGTFKVSGLQPVLYTLNVSMPAYVNTSFDPENRSPKQYKVGDSVTFVLTKGAVITGTVTTTTGDPVVGISVRALMIRNDKGKQINNGLIAREIPTDDRGIYRIYGLPAGTYIVVAGGNQNHGSVPGSVFETNLPTYATSATRDTAAEISVRPGEEATNIDIRYRGDPGRIISGVARRSSVGEISGLSVNLTSAVDPLELSVSDFQYSETAGFVFFGVADGDYYITAHTYQDRGEVELSESKLIKVRGADIEGIELTAKPMASITGRVVLEELKTPECKDKDRPVFKETFVSAWHRQTEAAKKLPQFIWNVGQPVPADPQGNVTLRNLAPSQYYFVARFPTKSWYLQSISFASPATGAKTGKPIDASRVWTNVTTGEKLSGLTVTLAQGAATLNGQIALREGETLPEKLFVYVVPAEKERADDVLRFYGMAVGRDGKIAMNSLAPGRYWVLAQAAIDEAEAPMRKLRWPDETETRAKLRRDAEAAKTEVELKPCQDVVDFKVPVRQD